MKKLWLLFFVITLSVFGQTSKDNSTSIFLDAYLSINTGFNIPVGDFGSSNYKKPNAGFATPGANFELNYIGRFYELIGVAIMFKTTSMAMNIIPVESYYNANDTGYYWGATRTPLKLKMAMFGFYTMAPITKAKNLFLFIKPMVGMGFVNASSTSYILFQKHIVYASGANPILAYSKGTVDYTQQASHALAYSIDLGLKYNLSPLLAFIFHVDYSITKPLFQSGIEISSMYYSNQQDLTPKYIKIQTLSFNLGLTLKVKGSD